MTNLVLWNSTLREGTQQSGVYFGLSEMIETADALLDCGLAHYIEMHCYPGKDDARNVKQMLRRYGERLVTHHRACASDVNNRLSIASKGNTSMYQTVSPVGLSAVGIRSYPQL